MRYFILGFLLLVVAVVGVAGFRGDKSKRPPIEIFPDMDRQPKLRPQTQNNFFTDQLSSQLPVEGTVARTKPMNVGGQTVYAFADHPVNTGRVTGTTNFVETNPMPVTGSLLKRGQERYAIYCTPCHGVAGDGKGVTSRLGMSIIADLHDLNTRKLVQVTDGELFQTISNGKNLMGGYAAAVGVEDRWAIIAYVRALQRSRLGTLDEVPEAVRKDLK
jgi:hypothetical protein